VRDLDATVPLDDVPDGSTLKKSPLRKVESDGGYAMRITREDNINLPLPMSYDYASVNKRNTEMDDDVYFYDILGKTRKDCKTIAEDPTYDKTNFRIADDDDYDTTDIVKPVGVTDNEYSTFKPSS